MKDYSNHYPSSKQRIYENGKSLFLKQENGFEGFDVLIDGSSYKVIIQQHTNPMNEQKEDRLLLCLDNVSIHRGSIVFYENDNWLVITDVDFNGVYKSCKIQKCNHILKFYNELSKLVSLPCIADDKTLWTLGISESNSSPITIGDAKLNVQMPDLIEAKCIDRDTRLIYDGLCWKVTTKSRRNEGLIYLVCGETQEMELDDLTNEIPANPYSPITISFSQQSYTLSQNNTLQLTPTITQNNNTLSLPLIYTSSNESIVTVDSNGLITGIGVGACKIKCALKDNPDIYTEINIEVSSNVIIPTNTYVIEGSDTLRKTSTITLIAKVYNNGIEVPNKQFDFRIANYNNCNPSDVIMTVINDCTIKIKNVNASSGSLYIIAQDRNSIYYADKDIHLTGIYG